ncbi:MAG: hypothetical protein QOF66_6940 [Mycobacterium sp.]|jgi:hypothetical protein|uniref:hypothetical protein n=1 Tax=Mycobacterium sp. TaxID=1785 RepID=UPI0028B2E176|nr:hypothetical protein [Mycobacterium sp.]
MHLLVTLRIDQSADHGGALVDDGQDAIDASVAEPDRPRLRGMETKNRYERRT